VRVLVLTPETPAYPASGGQSRQHCLLEPLAQRHEIRVLSTGDRPRFGRLPVGVDVQFIPPDPLPPAPPGGWLRRNVRRVTSGESFDLHFLRHQYDPIARVLEAEVERFKPDVVQAEHVHMAPLLAMVPPLVATVLVLHNLMWRMSLQGLAFSDPRELGRAIVEGMLLGRAERSYLETAAAVVVASDADRRLAERVHGRGRLYVVPNCIDVGYMRRNAPEAPDPTIIMPAHFGWSPNAAAARELLDRVLPAVRGRVAGTQLVLAGRGLTPELAAAVERTPGARATGEVEDIRPELHRAWVMAAPLRTGSGSPIKVMESLAASVPVVTTGRALRALGLHPGEGAIAARGPSDFAAQLASLLRDGERRSDLGRRGAEIAAARFDRQPAAMAQETVWRDAVTATTGLAAK